MYDSVIVPVYVLLKTTVLKKMQNIPVFLRKLGSVFN